MSIGDIRALEGDGSGEETPADAPPVAETTVVEATEAKDTTSKNAPLIHPAKLIDLEHDLPVRLPAPVQHIKVKENGHNLQKSLKPATSTASLYAPPTPDRQVSFSHLYWEPDTPLIMTAL